MEPKLKVEYMDVGELIPYANNAKEHPDWQVEQIAAIIDTVLFIGIAFGLGFGWLFDPKMLPALAAMMVGQYILKVCLAAIDTPFFYLMTRRRDNDRDRASLLKCSGAAAEARD